MTLFNVCSSSRLHIVCCFWCWHYDTSIFNYLFFFSTMSSILWKSLKHSRQRWTSHVLHNKKFYFFRTFEFVAQLCNWQRGADFTVGCDGNCLKYAVRWFLNWVLMVWSVNPIFLLLEIGSFIAACLWILRDDVLASLSVRDDVVATVACVATVAAVAIWRLGLK